jgi:type IX secretion system PorP/SprF family membrane protein
MKMRLSAFAWLMIAVVMAFAQQRPVTSTYMYNGLVLNPAYAGSLNLFSATVTNRDQWLNIEGAPITQSLAVHNSFYSNQVGGGLLVTRDKIGVHEDIGVYGSYAYKIRMKPGILALGIQGGFNSRRSNFTETDPYNPGDPYYTQITKFTPNFGTGIYFANRKMYAGASIPYLMKNRVYDIEVNAPNESRESRYYYFTGGVVFDLSQLVKLSPSVLVRYQENNPLGWDLNGTIIFEDIAYAGVSYRSGDALVFVTQFILNENLRVGYAYDAITSPLSFYSKGTHEIMVNYRIKMKNYKKDPQCPVYF